MKNGNLSCLDIFRPWLKIPRFLHYIKIYNKNRNLFTILVLASSRLTKTASTSSRRMIEFSGASANLWASRSSDIDRSDRFSTQIEYWSSPAKAVIYEVLPQPGGPCRRYPLLYGIPRDLYQSRNQRWSRPLDPIWFKMSKYFI